MRASALLGGLAWLWPAQLRPAWAQPAVAPGLLDYAGGALARMIEASRERAIADGVRPMPPGVQRALLGFFPDGLLRRVRYGVAPEQGRLALPLLAFSYGDAAAITLVDVVLFRQEHVAQTDLVLWAHELTHVMQYERWGVEGFAQRYVRDHDGVEKEARDNAARFKAWRGGRK